MHNMYLEIYVDRGIIGLLSYMYILVYILFEGLKCLAAKKIYGYDFSVLTATIVCVINFLVVSITSDHFFILANIWYLMALLWWQIESVDRISDTT